MSLKELYKNEIKQKLADEFEVKNPMLIPALEKITISVGLGEGGRDKKYIENVVNTISTIAGQKLLLQLPKNLLLDSNWEKGWKLV